MQFTSKCNLIEWLIDFIYYNEVDGHQKSLEIIKLETLRFKSVKYICTIS